MRSAVSASPVIAAAAVARDAGVAFAAAAKREYDGKLTKRERALAIKQLMCKLDVALSDIEGAS